METSRQTITVEDPSDEVFKQIAREANTTGMREYDVIVDESKMKNYFKSKFSKRNIVALTDMKPDEVVEDISTFQLYGISYFIK